MLAFSTPSVARWKQVSLDKFEFEYDEKRNDDTAINGRNLNEIRRNDSAASAERFPLLPGKTKS